MGREAEVRDGGENIPMAYGTLVLKAHIHPCFTHGFGCSTSLVIKRIITISDVEIKEKTLEKT